MEIYVGVDGGGSKTEALVMDFATERFTLVTGPSTNPNSAGWSAAIERIARLIQQGFTCLGATPADVRAVCCAVAGVGNEQNRQKLEVGLFPLLPGIRLEVVSDALAALSAGTKGQEGIVLIGGTGSIAVGERRDGRVARAGGYGYLVSDEGSGFEMGRRGIRAAIASHELRGPRTQLWDKVREFFKITSPLELTPVIYKESSNPVTTVASFAKEVLSLAEHDEVADAIVLGAVESHALLVDSVDTRLEFSCDDRPKVVVAGGLYQASDAMYGRLVRARPGYKFTKSQYPPAAGSVLRAALLDVTDSAERENRIRRWDAVMANPKGEKACE